MQTLSNIQNAMRNDRLNGTVSTESYDEYYNKLQEMRPENAVDPLPHSPCIRIKKTGVIWPWNEDFACRPDLCECCNEDGSPWPGAPVKVTPPPVINATVEPMRVQNDHTSPVGLAHEKLGIDKSYAVDYSQGASSRGAFPIPKQEAPIDVSSIIDAVFNSNVK